MTDKPKQKHPGGRPTKYNADMLAKAKDYLQNYKEYGEQVVPSVSGLAIALDVNKSTLYEWAEKKAEFSVTLEKIKETQETKLINKGLAGEFQATITKLMLANYGYHEKQEIETITKDPIKVTITPVKPK